MALQLMAMGDFEGQAGTLPPEDTLWRAALGFPTARALARAEERMGRAVAGGDAWADVWKPELMAWFQVIDPVFCRQRPQWGNQMGRVWHPLLDVWEQDPPEAASPRAAAKARAVKAKKAAGRLDFDPAWDYPAIRYPDSAIKRMWDVPLSQDARMTLWDQAIALLAQPDQPKTAEAARVFVGKLIKQYGEKDVAGAIAQMMVRPLRPADPKSFLSKQLQVMTAGGSERAVRAVAQRTRVAL